MRSALYGVNACLLYSWESARILPGVLHAACTLFPLMQGQRKTPCPKRPRKKQDKSDSVGIMSEFTFSPEEWERRSNY